MPQRHGPLNIAHRGASAEAPENTLAAIRLGMERGCDAFEIDVQLTKDDELILCHDFTVDRTTNGTGAIAEMTAAELRRLDAGSWFSPAFAGERLPLLEEVFATVPAHMMINIEIKMHPAYAGRIEPALVRCLERTGRMDSVVVSSFDHPALVRLKQQAPDVKIGLLYSADLVSHHRYADLFPVPVYSLHPYHQLIQPEAVRQATEHGLQVYVWTVNSAERMRQMIAAGASGIITDVPGTLANLLNPRP